MSYPKWSKITRLDSPVTVTEKIDGTNGLVAIYPFAGYDGPDIDEADAVAFSGTNLVFAGSRNRWLTVTEDNHGFAAWVRDHAEELVDALGQGIHHGEFWGRGIQRGYGLSHRVFSVFDTRHDLPETTANGACILRVPVVYSGLLSGMPRNGEIFPSGSRAAPGYARPEGAVIRWDHDGSRKKVVLDKPVEKTPHSPKVRKPQWTPEQVWHARMLKEAFEAKRVRAEFGDSC